MQTFHLRDDFTDPEAERSLLVSITEKPDLLGDLSELLTEGTFEAEADAWKHLTDALNKGKKPDLPSGWAPSADPHETARRLADLHQRRQLADIQEHFFQALRDEKRPAADLAALLEEEAARVQSSIKETAAGRLEWGSDFLSDVLKDAEERTQERQRTGQPVMGLRTGINSFDDTLNGLEKGLHILAGPPSIGKTTFCHFLSAQVAAQAPVVYVTFENSKESLTLKTLAARAGIDTKRIRRGEADMVKLRQAAQEWEPFSRRIAYIEGSSSLTVQRVRTKVREAMNRHGSDTCLVVVDYLQLWAKSAAHLRNMGTIRERVEAMAAELRSDLAMRIGVPVVAICSVNRGENGKGYDNPDLQNLKESGDLEFDGDTISFLMPSDRPATKPARALKIKIAKNREGEKDVPIEVIFRADIGVIREREATDR